MPAAARSDEEEAASAKSLPEQCERVHNKVWELLRRETEDLRVREVQRQMRVSLGVIAEALARYSLDELSFSYNGGKDCLVLLVLYLAALHSHSIGERVVPPSSETNGTSTTTNTNATTTTHKPHHHQLPPTLRSVYIVSPNPFPAVTSFVLSSSQHYHLSLSHYTQPMKSAFAAYLSDHPTIRAIFVGTRRTDPHGAQLTHFDPTTDDWPSFMRIHPVIDWHYADIWTFIRELDVPYCELYDRGYTSLGGTEDTMPNPALRLEGREGEFRPAYELVEDEEERLGRDWAKSVKKEGKS